MRELVLVEFRRVDVDVNDLPVLGELAHLARDAIVETDTEGEQQVGVIDGIVRVDGAVHAEHLQAQIVLGRKAAQPVQGQGDRNASTFGEFLQRRRGARGDDAAATVDDRPLRSAKLGDHALEFLPGGLPGRIVARQVHRRVPVGNNRIVLQILGDVDDHGAGPARAGDVERLLHHAHDVFGPLDEVMVLGDSPADLDDRRFLERIGADDAGADLARDGDHRHGIELGVGQAGDEIGRARPAGGHAHAYLAGGARIAVRHEAAALLVARQNRAKFALHPGQRLVQGHAGPAGIRENGIDPVADQAFNQDVGALHQGTIVVGFGKVRHRPSPRSSAQ